MVGLLLGAGDFRNDKKGGGTLSSIPGKYLPTN
jgi:hypothetical protein